MMLDKNNQQSKGAQKGIGKDSKIEYQTYLDTLYSTSPFIIPQRRMQFNKKLGSMTILEQQKSGLNPIYTKLLVDNDLITVTPLMKNNQYI